MFNDIVSVYNYYKNTLTKTESWQKTVLYGVQWQEKQERGSQTNGDITVSTLVSMTIIDSTKATNGRTYVDPITYSKLPADMLSKHFTLNPKSNQDIIILGDTKKEIDDVYTLSKLKKDFNQIATIQAVSDNRNKPFLKNIKVIGQ